MGPRRADRTLAQSLAAVPTERYSARHRRLADVCEKCRAGVDYSFWLRPDIGSQVDEGTNTIRAWKMELLLTSLGIVSSGFFSWLFTHLYYRKALAKQAADASAQIRSLATLVEQGKDSADLQREVLKQERIENCCLEHQRAGTPEGLIDSYEDLTSEEKAHLLDAALLRVKGRKPKTNKYRGEGPAT